MIKNSLDGKKKAVRIGVGAKAGIKPGDEFSAYTFAEVEDPVTGRKGCDVRLLPVSLIVSSDQLQQNAAWAMVEAPGPEQLRLIGVGQLVERKSRP